MVTEETLVERTAQLEALITYHVIHDPQGDQCQHLMQTIAAAIWPDAPSHDESYLPARVRLEGQIERLPKTHILAWLGRNR